MKNPSRAFAPIDKRLENFSSFKKEIIQKSNIPQWALNALNSVSDSSTMHSGLGKEIQNAFVNQSIDVNKAEVLSYTIYYMWHQYALTNAVKATVADSALYHEKGIYADVLNQILDAHHDASNWRDVVRADYIIQELKKINASKDNSDTDIYFDLAIKHEDNAQYTSFMNKCLEYKFLIKKAPTTYPIKDGLPFMDPISFETVLNAKTPATPEVIEKINVACINNDVETIKYYHDIGFDLDDIKVGLTQKPLLFLAIHYGRPEVFKTLLSLGLDINAKYKGKYLIHEAVSEDRQDILNMLLEMKADINALDDYGSTPFALAARLGLDQMMLVLLEIPTVDVNILAILKEGNYSPLYSAIANNKTEIIHKIIAHPLFDPNFQIVSNYLSSAVQNYIKNSPLINDVDNEVTELFDLVREFGLKFELRNCFKLNSFNKHVLNCFSFEGAKYDSPLLYNTFEDFYKTVFANSNSPSWAMNAFDDIYDAVAFSANSMTALDYVKRMDNDDLVIFPSGWMGHRIYFVIQKENLYLINRGDFSDGTHGIIEYKINNYDERVKAESESNSESESAEEAGLEYLEFLLDSNSEIPEHPYQKSRQEIILESMIGNLNLSLVHKIKNPTQVSGSCVWASAETAIEAAFISTFLQQGIEFNLSHRIAKDLFDLFEEYDLSNTLLKLIHHKDLLIKEGIFEEILLKMFETHHDINSPGDMKRCIVVCDELEKYENEIKAEFKGKINELLDLSTMLIETKPTTVCDAYTDRSISIEDDENYVVEEDESHVEEDAVEDAVEEDAVEEDAVEEDEDYEDYEYYEENEKDILKTEQERFIEQCEQQYNTLKKEKGPINLLEVLDIPTSETLEKLLNQYVKEMEVPSKENEQFKTEQESNQQCPNPMVPVFQPEILQCPHDPLM